RRRPVNPGRGCTFASDGMLGPVGISLLEVMLDVACARAEALADRSVPHARSRHGFPRGPGGPADPADPRAHRAPAGPQEGPSFAPRPVEDGREAPPPAELPAGYRARALPGPDRTPGAAPLAGEGSSCPDPGPGKTV